MSTQICICIISTVASPHTTLLPTCGETFVNTRVGIETFRSTAKNFWFFIPPFPSPSSSPFFFSPSVVLILNRKKQVYEQFTKSGTARTPRQSGTPVTKKERSRLTVLTIHLNNLSNPPLTACSTCFSFKRKNIRLYTPPSKWSHWRYRSTISRYPRWKQP